MTERGGRRSVRRGLACGHFGLAHRPDSVTQLMVHSVAAAPAVPIPEMHCAQTGFGMLIELTVGCSTLYRKLVRFPVLSHDPTTSDSREYGARPARI